MYDDQNATAPSWATAKLDPSSLGRNTYKCGVGTFDISNTQNTYDFIKCRIQIQRRNDPKLTIHGTTFTK